MGEKAEDEGHAPALGDWQAVSSTWQHLVPTENRSCQAGQARLLSYPMTVGEC